MRTTSRIKLTKLFDHASKPLGVVAGMAIGAVASKAIKKVVISEPVKGLIGLEGATTLSSYAAPALVFAGGMIGLQMSNKNEFAKYISIGIAGYGAYDAVKTVIGKDPLSGLGLFEDDVIAGIGSTNPPMAIPSYPSYSDYERLLQESKTTEGLESDYQVTEGIGYEEEFQGLNDLSESVEIV